MKITDPNQTNVGFAHVHFIAIVKFNSVPILINDAVRIAKPNTAPSRFQIKMFKQLLLRLFQSFYFKSQIFSLCLHLQALPLTEQ